MCPADWPISGDDLRFYVFDMQAKSKTSQYVLPLWGLVENRLRSENGGIGNLV